MRLGRRRECEFVAGCLHECDKSKQAPWPMLGTKRVPPMPSLPACRACMGRIDPVSPGSASLSAADLRGEVAQQRQFLHLPEKVRRVVRFLRVVLRLLLPVELLKPR